MNEKYNFLVVLIIIIVLILVFKKHNNRSKESFFTGPFYGSFYGYRRSGMPTDYYYPYRYKYGHYLYPKYMRDYDLWRYRYQY